ncbi:hypothetical protein EK21DRAFT_106743 [Setomelanomma holmii]|uniref:Uncharacterized protein n=1 Tax=Setomelanomma holmii TaxID=210430 RepID=A0A9P4HIK0_9PLEO|nr:hypothetical protein EK21DRAFT_106743 [Setomelanomma holmii]
MACQSFFGPGGTIVATLVQGSKKVVTTTTYKDYDVLNAYGVIVARATSTAQAPQTGLATQTTSPASTSSSMTPTPNDSSHGLSSSAKAGIGGGIAGGVLLFALGGILGYIVHLRRKRKLGTDLNNEQVSHEGHSGSPFAKEMVYTESELPPGETRSELPTRGAESELSAGREAHELPS